MIFYPILTLYFHEMYGLLYIRPLVGLINLRQEHLLELQLRTPADLWVQCDTCEAWRALPPYTDPADLQGTWTCLQNTGRKVT